MIQSWSKQSADYLEALAEELEIGDARYEAAEASYKALGDWLGRDGSSLRTFLPKVYVQGSFLLGTVIKPWSDHEEYDIDSVCELALLIKSSLTQRDLKRRVHTEIESYRVAHGMTKPLREKTRCWRLNYADGSRFHMDVVPALPNGTQQRMLLEARGHDAQFAGTAIAITDNTHPAYDVLSEDWPRSNPRGYGAWFRVRMGAVYRRRRQVLAERLKASVEALPDYKVRTPLQLAIMILKRHRDMWFSGQPDLRPISIIITTLAAHAYQGEESVAGALASILAGMHRHIVQRADGTYVIPNPTDPLENFADKWVAHPERGEAFFAWLRQAQADFARISTMANWGTIAEALQGRIGPALARKAAERGASRPSSMLRAATVAPLVGGSASPAFGDQPRIPARPKGFA